jgi:hypothetical protein
LLVYPFSKIVAVYGKPISPGPLLDEAGFERERRRVEQLLSELDVEADQYFGKSQNAPG